MTTRDDLALANRLADAAGAAIRPFFRARYDLEIKADKSPVTEADRAAEAAIRAILEKERPNDGIIGEEYGSVRTDAERVWILDPIDGTRSFIAGRPIFGTLIALTQGSWPTIGIIDQPIAQERWAGMSGQPTTFNGKPVRTRACKALEGAGIATTSPHLFAEGDVPHYMALVGAVSGGSPRQGPVYGGDCYNYGLLASGFLDIVIESGLQSYDFAALVPVVEGAGGLMCDWNGEPLTAESEGHVLALGDPARLEDVLETIHGAGDGHDHGHHHDH
ncbi:inositol monophosphatase family protein [Sphingobium yanoikuyae]|uniref:inositol monophosphatase family protein n=1 Tax=Sphingobium yanoikuyae TaxID=13690 RepID=UPI003F0E9089